MKKLPLSISGLMLGITALANLLGQYFAPLRPVLLLPAVMIGLALLAKCLLYPKEVSGELSQLLPLSSFPTLFMALSLMSVALPSPLGHLIWYLALLSHLVYLIFFTQQVIKQGHSHKIQPYPSWFIVYVGPATATVTAGFFKEAILGQAVFIFTCLTYLIMMLVLLLQLPHLKDIPPKSLPNLAIMSAPSSLLLLAFLSFYPHPTRTLVLLLLFLSQFFFIVTTAYLFKKIRRPFSPAFVAFTFPSVSTATALKTSLAFLSLHTFWSNLLLLAEIILAIILVDYVIWGEIKWFMAS